MRMAWPGVKRLALLLSLMSCSNSSGPSPLNYGDTGVLTGGYAGTGFSAFGQVLDPQFRYLYFNTTLAEGSSWTCFTDGYCSLGGMTNQFGGLAAADTFLFVSTANFVPQGPDTEVVVVSSGVEAGFGIDGKGLTIPNPSQYDSLRVSFEWAFLTSRFDSATHNDSLVVRIRTSTDSSRLFKVTTADLEAGRYSAKAGGCGSQAVIAGRPITYGHCTDWAAKTLDVTRFLKTTFGLEFIVSEGGQSLSDHVDEPSALLFRKLKLEGGK